MEKTNELSPSKAGVTRRKKAVGFIPAAIDIGMYFGAKRSFKSPWLYCFSDTGTHYSVICISSFLLTLPERNSPPKTMVKSTNTIQATR